MRPREDANEVGVLASSTTASAIDSSGAREYKRDHKSSDEGAGA